jgi:6-phosphogluconate dehydrogenase (decarboxylating)
MQLGMVGLGRMGANMARRLLRAARFRSRQEHTFGEKLLSAMRRQFGGHAEARAEPKE